MLGIRGTAGRQTGPIDEVVGQALRDLRLGLGLEPSAMASLLDVTVRALTEYEQGVSRAPAAFLLTVCQRLHVSPDSFYRNAPCAAAPTPAVLQPARIPRTWTV